MSDDLVMFLVSKVTSEMMSLYLRGSAVIAYYERDDVYEMLERYLMELDDTPNDEAIDFIYNAHLDCLKSIVEEYGLTLHEDEVRLEDCLSILDALQCLEDHEDKVYIREVLMNSEENVYDTLIELLSFCSFYEEEYFISKISTVEPLLLSKILEKCAVTIEDDGLDDQYNDNNKLYDKLKLLKDDNEYARTYVFSLIKSGVALKLDLATYLKLFGSVIFEDGRNLNLIAEDLALLALISSDEGDKVNVISDLLVHYTEGALQATNILQLLRNHVTSINSKVSS